MSSTTTLRVEPDIASKTVKGEVVLTFLITASGRTTIELDRGDLTIDSVREGGQAREFVRARPQAPNPAGAPV